jgi:signal transduction histidine kinase
MLGEQGGVFLCTDKDVKSSAKFKGILSVYFGVLSEILGIKDAQAEKKAIHLRRLTHNLISYNAHILQDLYSIVPQERLAGNGQDQISAFLDAIITKPKDAAVSLLRILKNTNLSKSEFSIFEKLYDENPTLEIYSHKIHKVILLVFNSFWYDFIQKRVKININRCDRKLNLDYESVSAAFAHIIDNAVKYTATGTELEVSFEEGGDAYIVKFDMVSMKIDPDEKYLIFNEGYSGRHPVRADLSGKGIGLGIVRKLLALNNATVSIQSDEDSSEIRTRFSVVRKKR